MLSPLEPNGWAQVSDHAHHHLSESGLGGYIFRLLAGGLALGGMLIHKLGWLPIGFHPGWGLPSAPS